MNEKKLQQAIEAALQALEELEKALHEGDHRKIGARLYELRRELNIIRSEVEDR